jgi:hypothetical protein
MHFVILKMEINSTTEFCFTIISQSDLRNHDIAFNKPSFSKGILDLAGGEGPSSPNTPRLYRQALRIPLIVISSLIHL